MSPKKIELKFKKNSSLFFYISPLIAFLGRTKTFKGIDTIPDISTQLLNTTINPDHLARFNRLCSIKPLGTISPIYPITLVFGFFQRILSLKQAPLSMFRVLGKRLQVHQIKALQLNESYDIHCKISDARIMEKGLEVDLSAQILANDKIIWSAVETFFYRGDFGEKTQENTMNNLPALSDPQEIFSWFLPEGMGYKFARISGDGNGLHYSKRYAKFFGFERDFAQPFLVIGQTFGAMQRFQNDRPLLFDVIFKGQCYYNKNISVKTDASNPQRLDIFCQGNERPCMSAKLILN